MPKESQGTTTDTRTPGVQTPNTDTENRARNTRNTSRYGGVRGPSERDFSGATPQIGGVLALRSENTTRKVPYEVFLKKLETYIMNEMKQGGHLVGITKNPNADVIADFESAYKPADVDETTATSVENEIQKETIKEYVKDFKLLKSNLKKAYSLMYGNCNDGVQAQIKADTDYGAKSKIFDYKWLFKKAKKVVSGLDSKVNLRVSLYSTMINLLLTKQQPNGLNTAYLTRFKSMARTLTTAGGEHIFVSKDMLGKDLGVATADEVKDEKEYFLAMCFILRSDKGRYKKLLEDLKSSANRGRDEYPKTLTDAFDLLVRESGEYDTTNAYGRGRAQRRGAARRA